MPRRDRAFGLSSRASNIHSRGLERVRALRAIRPDFERRGEGHRTDGFLSLPSQSKSLRRAEGTRGRKPESLLPPPEI